MSKFQNLEAGMYVSGKNSVYLRVVCKLTGADGPIFGLVSPKEPNKVEFFTLWEMEGKGTLNRGEAWNSMTIVPDPDWHEFDTLKVGDYVSVGFDEGEVATCRVLAVVDDAVLLSDTASNGARKALKEIQEMVATAGNGRLANVMQKAYEDSDIEGHLKAHASITQAHNKADGWYDKQYMTLMNWHPLKEEF